MCEKYLTLPVFLDTLFSETSKKHQQSRGTKIPVSIKKASFSKRILALLFSYAVIILKEDFDSTLITS